MASESNEVPTRRMQNFHFSGKVIMCSVFFGFGLVLIGAILMAINNGGQQHLDADSVKPTSNLSFSAGAAAIGIGGFAVIVGVLMCLVETKVCRKKNTDTNPLITSQEDIRSETPELEQSKSSSLSSTSRKKSPMITKAKTARKKHSSGNGAGRTKPKSPVLVPQPKTDAKVPKVSQNFLNASEDFLTPPNSFVNGQFPMKPNSYKQISPDMRSIRSSFEKSLTTSAEFQTPSTSFGNDSLSVESSVEMQNHEESSMSFDGMSSSSQNLFTCSDDFSSPIVTFEEKSMLTESQINALKEDLGSKEPSLREEQESGELKSIPDNHNEVEPNNQTSSVLAISNASNAVNLNHNAENAKPLSTSTEENNNNVPASEVEFDNSKKNLNSLYLGSDSKAEIHDISVPDIKFDNSNIKQDLNLDHGNSDTVLSDINSVKSEEISSASPESDENVVNPKSNEDIQPIASHQYFDTETPLVKSHQFEAASSTSEEGAQKIATEDTVQEVNSPAVNLHQNSSQLQNQIEADNLTDISLGSEHSQISSNDETSDIVEPSSQTLCTTESTDKDTNLN